MSIMQDSLIGTLDLRIINALQIWPRAPWAQLAPIIGADAATLNRRWRELNEQGLAWITTFDTERWNAAVMVEINCHSGTNMEVAAALAKSPDMIAVDLTAGGRDIIATVAARSETALWAYLLEELPKIANVESVRSHPIARNFVDARSWRLRALDKSETSKIDALPRQTHGRPASSNADLEREIVVALNRDGRVTATAIGSQLGETPRRIREIMAAMSAAGRLQQRTDIARSISDWPVNAWYFLRVPASKLEGIGSRLGNLDEVRLVSHTVGPYDLLMAVWLKTLAEVQKLEQHMELRLPGIETVDRSVVLRTVKQLGQILDAEGRATGLSLV